MSDNKVDLSMPVTDAEIKKRMEGLSPEQLQDVRDQQILDEIRSRREKAAEPDWGRMGDAEFLRERMKRYGY
jgi:hypothetical protein